MADPDSAPRHGRRERVLLSLFFCLHFGAVFTYVAPSDPSSLSGLPEVVRAPVARVAPPLARKAWPLARPYLNLTATRQHWFLFSPSPAQWASSLDVMAYYPADPSSGPWSREGAEGSGSVGDTAAEGRWRVDTLRVYGPREAPLPHWWSHRSFRVVFNMGYEGWGEFYRPYYARALCRRLGRLRGTRPGGIELTAVWERTKIPWMAGDGTEMYHQDLGGYTCPDPEDDGARSSSDGPRSSSDGGSS